MLFFSPSLSYISLSHTDFNTVQHIDFEGRTNEEATYFLEVIMPRHAVHVKSIWFRTTIAENDIYDDYLIQEEGEDEFMRGEEANDAVPSQSHAETARLQAVEAAATQKHKWNEKERRKIFASIIGSFPFYYILPSTDCSL